MSKKISLLILSLALCALSLSCGNGTAPAPAAPVVIAQPQTELDQACPSPIFGFGRSIPYGELRRYGSAKFGLESVLFRNVLYRSPNEVELAYLVDVKMRLEQDQFLVPTPQILCRESPRPSRRSEKLSRAMIPVLGDLHLPSSRITVFDTNEGDRLYNYPRISEISVSSGGYFSFNQNWTPYRRLQTLADYLDLLRTRHFYSMIDVREMGPGRMGIVAEKNIGGEKTQLLITLIEVQ